VLLAALIEGAQDVAPDTAIAVNCHSDGHLFAPGTLKHAEIDCPALQKNRGGLASASTRALRLTEASLSPLQ
jgi:hypothetical protein